MSARPGINPRLGDFCRSESGMYYLRDLFEAQK